MPATDPTAAPPLPPRVQWFAPWRRFPHWRPWQRWAMVAGVVLVGYVLSPAPAIALLDALDIEAEPIIVVWYPLWMMSETFQVVKWFYSVQFEWLGFGWRGLV